MENKIVIGVFGFGVVGKGLYDALNSSSLTNFSIKTICVKHLEKHVSFKAVPVTDRPEVILNDPEINTVLELIDDSEAAYRIVKTALENGKNVVSASKKMIAEHLEELIELSQKNNVSLLYEASACGSIPIIRSLEEYYDNDFMESVAGILNGSSNYILSKIYNENSTYEVALKQAQELGFAESNPTFDVDGYDTMYKLIILVLHSYGAIIKPEQVYFSGISKISNCDIRYAKEKGLKIKLVGQAVKLPDGSLTAFVLPRFVTPDKYIYNVENQFNGVVIRGKFYDKQFMFGKGAGGHPTGSAVLSDLTALAYNYKYEYKKRKNHKVPKFTTDVTLQIYLRYKSDDVLKHFNFTQIIERYTGPECSYIIGKVSLSNLLANNELIRSLDAFVALTENGIN